MNQDDDASVDIPKKSKKKLESKTVSLKDFNESFSPLSDSYSPVSDGEEEKKRLTRNNTNEALNQSKVEENTEPQQLGQKQDKSEEDKKKDTPQKEEKKEENKEIEKKEEKEEKKEEKKDDKKDPKIEKKDEKKDIKKEDIKKKLLPKKEEKKVPVKNDKKAKGKKDDKKTTRKDSQGEVIVLTDIEVLAEELPEKESDPHEKARDKELLNSNDHDNEDRISLVVTEVEDSDKPKKGFNLFKRIKNLKVAKQEQKKAATRIQAVWRGYIFRKKLSAIGKASTLVKQGNAIRQLISIETTYVANLSTICTSYLHPLREFNKFNEESRKAFPLTVVNTIFRNIEAIYTVHKAFLADLEKKSELWPFCKDIPSLLLRICGNFATYLRYAEEAAVADETLRNYKDIPPLSTFLTTMYNDRKQNAKAPVLDLPALLVLPYKHISKVWNVCTILMNSSPATMTDFSLLADAVGILSQLKKLIWNVAEEAINKRKMTILSTRIQTSRLVSIPKESKPRIIDLQPKDNLTSSVETRESPSLTPTSKRRSKKIEKKPEKKKDDKKGRLTPKKNEKPEMENGENKKENVESSSPKSEVLNNIVNNNGNSKELEKIEEKEEKPEILLGQDIEERTFELYAPHRKLVKNGSLMVNSKKRHIFLFNDVCVILQVVSSLTSKFEAFFELKEAKISAKSVSLETSTQKFMIKSTNGSFVFVEKLSEGGEPSWMQTFEELIQYTTDKLFGSPLETIVNRERTAIPTIVLNIIQSLNKNISCTGLFQTQYNPKVVQALRDPAAQRKLHNANPHDVIGLLIMYLEQLPDLIIPFDSKDQIFSAQSAPSEEKLLTWVRAKVDSMSIHEKNLLEYLMSFLAKVLERASSNRIHSINLGVLFGPLIIRPKDLTLEYCFKMPRIIRIVEMIIVRAGDLFKTADDISNPLPISIEEFLLSDQFAQPWWRDFGQKKPYFIQYIVKEQNIKQLVDYILEVPDNDEESEINKRKSQFASSSYGILVNDGVIQHMLEDYQLLNIIVKEFKGQKISERANKYFCDFIEIILRGNTESFAIYLDQFPDMNVQLIHSIGSGNFCNMILSIAEAWQSKESFHHIVVSWGVIVLKLVLTASDTPDSDQLANSIRFLRFLIRTNSFMSSSLSAPFVELLETRNYLKGLLDRSLNSDIDTCVCCIPLVIEILVHSKTKAPPSKNNDDNYEQNTPIIALTIGELHETLISRLRENLDKKPLPPLGFFRFGIVKLIQALLITNYPYCNMIIVTTDLIGACLDLFFLYYQHSILHSVIAYIIRYIMAIGNAELIKLLIVKYKLATKLIEIFELEEHKQVLTHLRGYLSMIALSIRKSSIAEELLRSDSKWENFVDELMREEKSQSESVTLAKRNISRNKAEFISDQLEDKIG